MLTASEIHLGRESRRETLEGLLLKGLIALAVLVIVSGLPACSDDFDRLQAQAEWQARVERAATPKEGELVTIREIARGKYIVRRYHGGLLSTDIIAREDQ